MTTVERMERAGERHEWRRHMQMRSPSELWQQRGCVSPFQVWVAYRDAVQQLNLFHAGRLESKRCPVNTKYNEQDESTSHIMWECRRAQASWNQVFRKWTGLETETSLNLLMPFIASRSPPTSYPSLLASITTHIGFFTTKHENALRTIWFMICTVIPSILWRQRNATVHEHIAATSARVCRARVARMPPTDPSRGQQDAQRPKTQLHRHQHAPVHFGARLGP